MKALVIYDSQYGNTAQIARAIADGLKSAATDTIEVDLRKIDDVRPEHLSGLDVLIVGSPTQRFSSTSAMRDFLKDIPKKALAGVTVAGFDTRLTEEELRSHGACWASWSIGSAMPPRASRKAWRRRVGEWPCRRKGSVSAARKAHCSKASSSGRRSGLAKL